VIFAVVASGIRPSGSGVPADLGDDPGRSVGLIVGTAEARAGRPEIGASASAVFHERGGLPLVRAGARRRVDAQPHLERRADRSSSDEADEAQAKAGSYRSAARQITSRGAVRTATVKFCEGRDTLAHSPDRGLCDHRPGV
jgi:hypothetical protein